MQKPIVPLGIETVKHNLRHRFLIRLLRIFAGPFVKLVFRFRCRSEKMPEEPSIVIANHNTNLDPAFVVIGLGHLYFVASEHAFRKGFRSKLLKFIFDPIPISKAQTDLSTLKEIFRRVKAGFNVCIFGEGNRSYNGVTGPVALATAKIVKTAGAGLITYRLEGGYFTTPRWSTKIRRGKMTSRVTGRYSAGEIKSMTAGQVLELIERGIYENAYERQKVNPVRFRGKKLAEDIQTVLYLCPLCKKTGTIHSKGSRFFCGCGLNAAYTETGFLESLDPSLPLPFPTITEWDIWQTEQLALTVKTGNGKPFCRDENQQLFMIDLAAGHSLAGEGPMYINRTELHCADHDFPIREITNITIVGQMTLQFALKNGTHYEIRSAFPRNALKYREIFRILQSENL